MKELVEFLKQKRTEGLTWAQVAKKTKEQGFVALNGKDYSPSALAHILLREHPECRVTVEYTKGVKRFRGTPRMSSQDVQRVAFDLYQKGKKPSQISKILFKDNGYYSQATGKRLTVDGVRTLLSKYKKTQDPTAPRTETRPVQQERPASKQGRLQVIEAILKVQDMPESEKLSYIDLLIK